MTVSNSPVLPTGLSVSVTTNGIAILGTPLVTGSNTYLITIQDLADNSVVTNSLSINVVSIGTPSGQSPLIVVSTNQYSGTTVAYIGRPPFLAEPAAPSNSFTMRFYYKNQAGFDWPGYTAPPVGAIVPYLLPKNSTGNFVGDPTKKTTTSQDIVYRPVWPSLVDGQPLPTLYSGQTLTEPINGLPAVRGQSSVQVLYQQSIATNNITNGFADQSVLLYDPTIQKTANLASQGLTKLPAGVVTASFEAKDFFPNLPPNLASRLWYDPSTTNLVFQGQFVDDVVGEKYLMLNVLAGADLAAVQQLCPSNDVNYVPWTNLVASLSAPLYTFHQTPGVPGSYVNDPAQTTTNFARDLVAISSGEQVFKLTWREGYQPGTSAGWSGFGAARANPSRPYSAGGQTAYVTKYWGLDHWATRTDMGAYLNWVVGNAILPPVDPDPSHQGIQKVDRTTVPELVELPQTAAQLQADMDNAEAGFTPLNLSQNAIPFDINPLQVTGANPMTHFEQIYSRALVALNNAVDAFNNAQGVTQQLRQAQNSLSDFQAQVTAQELAYNDQLIELYGTPYPNDMGPGQTYPQGYTGPDLIHYTYVENPDTNTFGGILPDPTQAQTNFLDIQQLPQG